MKSPTTQRKENAGISQLPNDSLYGLGCHPDSLQKCARLPCFVLVYSIAGLLTQSLSAYISSQITSIEKQFGLNSRQTGLLLSCNDIGFLVAVLFTSHFLSKGPIPVYLGVVTLLYGASGIVCALPHLLLGVTSDTFDKNGANANFEENILCQANHNSSRLDSADCVDHGGYSYTSMAFAIIATGMVLQGIAKSPRTALVTAYIDGNVADKTRTGFMIGIISAVGILGVAVALGLGSVFSSIYVTLEDTEIRPNDPRWIGAWWLGFIVFGVAAVLISLPVSCFPKRFPTAVQSYPPEDENASESKVHTIDSEDAPVAKDREGNTKRDKRQIGSEIKDFLKILRRLSMNSVFMIIVLSTALKMMAMSGTISYGPKYLEIQFMEPAWKANLIFGGLRMVDLFLATLAGGYLTTRLRLSRTGNMKLILIASAIGCIASGVVMLFGCDQPIIQDFNRLRSPSLSTHLEKRSSGDGCSVHCACESNQFLPVCGEDGVNYYSPCHAGCGNGSVPYYSQCSCIGNNGSAVSGICETECTQIIPYSIVSFIINASTILQLVPTFMAIIRSVGEDEKSAALGVGSLLNTLLGMLPGPILFGMIFDQTCLVWKESCNRRGSCALYDLEDLRISYQTFSVGLSVLSLALFFVGFIIAHRKDRKSVELPKLTLKETELEIRY